MAEGHPDDEALRRRDEEALRRHADVLAAAIEGELEGWVRRSVELRAAQAGVALDEASREALADAASTATAEVGEQVRDLLGTDIDLQRCAPLQLLREAVRYPTAVLHRAGVPPVVRDEFSQRQFPADDYDLTPASFADVHRSLHEPGLTWGAAKAHVHLSRRRRRER